MNYVRSCHHRKNKIQQHVQQVFSVPERTYASSFTKGVDMIDTKGVDKLIFPLIFLLFGKAVPDRSVPVDADHNRHRIKVDYVQEKCLYFSRFIS